MTRLYQGLLVSPTAWMTFGMSSQQTITLDFIVRVDHAALVHIFNKLSHTHFYGPQSEGDNVLGSVRPSVRLDVRLSVLSRLNCLTYDLDIWYLG